MHNIFAGAKESLRKINSVLDSIDNRDRHSPKFFRTKILFAAISLVSALFLWSFVAWDGTAEITRTIEVPVKYVNIGQGMASFNSVAAVSVKIAGNISSLSKLDKNELVAKVDLSGIKAGKYDLPVSIDVPTGIRLISWKPTLAEVEIYKKSEKLFRISLKPVGKDIGDEQILSAEILPATALVSAPASEMSLIYAVEARVPFENLKSGNAYTAELVAVNENGNPVSKAVINPRTVVVKSDTSEQGKTVPVKIELKGIPAQGYEISSVQISPQEVTLKGDINEIEQLQQIELPAIDVSGIDEDLHTVLPLKNAEMSDDIKIAGADTVTVDVRLKKASNSKTFSDVPIIIEGAKHGEKWVSHPSAATIVAEGAHIAEMQESPCTVVADVTSIVSNKITLPLIAKNVKNGIKIISIEPEEATLKLENAK